MKPPELSHKEALRSFILSNFLFDESHAFNDSDSFMGKGIVDSTGILEIVSFIEERFHIKVADDELLPDNLDSINKLAAFISRKTGAH